MIVVIGEILFDVFPGYRKIGGAPFNFAVHLKRFGFPVRFISRVGNDQEGLEVAGHVRKYGLDANDIQIDDVLPTGRVIVSLDKKGVPDFDIVKNCAYDNIDLSTPDLKENIDMLYFGTLIQRSSRAFQRFSGFLEGISSEPLKFCDINLRQNCYNEKTVLYSIDHSDILKLNVDELGYLRTVSDLAGTDESVLQSLYEKYSLHTIALTNGSGESIIYDGEFHKRIPPGSVTVKDTVGAGDAFASVLAAGVMTGMDGSAILREAVDFASAICSVEGAIPEETGYYRVKGFQNNGK